MRVDASLLDPGDRVRVQLGEVERLARFVVADGDQVVVELESTGAMRTVNAYALLELVSSPTTSSSSSTASTS